MTIKPPITTARLATLNPTRPVDDVLIDAPLVPPPVEEEDCAAFDPDLVDEPPPDLELVAVAEGAADGVKTPPEGTRDRH